jgi:uncharacterized protein
MLRGRAGSGTKLDEEWAAFFVEHDFLVGISIDGPQDVHDAHRVTKGGRGSFDLVMRGLGFLRGARAQYDVLTTVNAANQERGREVYRFLRDECGAEFMQFIPVIERAAEATGDGGAPWSSWRDRPLFDTTLANWVGEQPGMCVHCETCGLALALEHNGAVFSCDHFVEPRYLLGNITNRRLVELVGSEQQQRFGADKRDTLPEYCLRCDARFACHGGCPKDRFITTPDGEPGLNYLCPGFKLFFEHVAGPMAAMAELLGRGRAPAELMSRYAADDARRGRNEPCPCGGGRKWKHCHGAAPFRAPEIRTSVSRASAASGAAE